MRPPRLGRLAFAAGSTLAFLPSVALAARDVLDGVGAMASGVGIEMAPDGTWGAPALADLPPVVGGPSAATLAAALAGWAVLGWLAAGRTRDIGGDPRVAWAVVPAGLAATLPASPWWIAVPAALAVLAWTTRLTFAKGRAG